MSTTVEGTETHRDWVEVGTAMGLDADTIGTVETYWNEGLANPNVQVSTDELAHIDEVLSVARNNTIEVITAVKHVASLRGRALLITDSQAVCAAIGYRLLAMTGAENATDAIAASSSFIQRATVPADQVSTLRALATLAQIFGLTAEDLESLAGGSEDETGL